MHPKKDKEPGIQCAIFLKQEPEIKRLTDRINHAQAVHEKAAWAGELQKEVRVLLECPEYKKQNADCRNCHLLALLRQRTADVIMMARKLG